MFGGGARRIERLLEAAPGPSPWYPVRSSTPVPTRHGPARWVSTGSAGVIALRAGSVDLCKLGFYWWVMMWGARPVLWHQGPRAIPTAPVQVLVLDGETLDPVSGGLPDADPAKGPGIRIGGAPVASIEIPTRTLGRSACTFPAALAAVPEILILADSSALPGSANLVLVVARPAEGSVELVPQDWFNQGEWDFGYQWPTRVARDPSTGRVVGDGIRMGVFELDDTCRSVGRWIRRTV